MNYLLYHNLIYSNIIRLQLCHIKYTYNCTTNFQYDEIINIKFVDVNLKRHSVFLFGYC